MGDGTVRLCLYLLLNANVKMVRMQEVRKDARFLLMLPPVDHLNLKNKHLMLHQTQCPTC